MRSKKRTVPVSSAARQVLLDALYAEDAALTDADRAYRGALAAYAVQRVLCARLRQVIGLLGEPPPRLVG